MEKEELVEKSSLQDKHLISIKYRTSESDNDSIAPLKPKFPQSSQHVPASPIVKGTHIELTALASSLRSSFKKTKDVQKDLVKKLRPIPYESQTSHDLRFFLQQEKDIGKVALISSQIRFVMFQFLWTSKFIFILETYFVIKYLIINIFNSC